LNIAFWSPGYAPFFIAGPALGAARFALMTRTKIACFRSMIVPKDLSEMIGSADRRTGVSALIGSGGSHMKLTPLAGISMLALATVAAPPNALAQGAAATNYWDGQYSGNFVTITHPSGNTEQCATINVAPALTIKNGTAKFSISNIIFQGIVTTDGELIMHSNQGQTFVGQFDPYFVLKGRVTGKCFYDATWEKYKKP
jgi:hypothetical protein